MQNGKRLIIILAAAALVLAAVLTAVIIRSNSQSKFTPPEFDAAAVEGMPAPPESLHWAKADLTLYTVYAASVLTVQDGSTDIYFTNPAENAVWVKLRLLDAQGAVLGETGLLKPGQYVQKIKLEKIPADGSAVSLKIMAYEPDTYHSAGSAAMKTTISVP